MSVCTFVHTNAKVLNFLFQRVGVQVFDFHSVPVVTPGEWHKFSVLDPPKHAGGGRQTRASRPDLHFVADLAGSTGGVADVAGGVLTLSDLREQRVAQPGDEPRGRRHPLHRVRLPCAARGEARVGTGSEDR